MQPTDGKSIMLSPLLFLPLFGCESDKGLTIPTAAPEVAIVSHFDGEEVTEGVEQVFVAAVSDPDNPNRDVTARWTIGGVEVCPFADLDDNGDSQCTHTVQFGDEQVTVEARDVHNAADTFTITLAIASAENQPPVLGEVSITPDPAYTDNSLVAEVLDGVDPEGADLTYSYAWYQNGVSTTHTTETVPATDTVKDDTWRVVVTPNDGEDDGVSAEDSLTISNSNPLLDTVNIVDGNSQSIASAGHGETVTCVATWTDADGTADATDTYAWTDASGSTLGAAADLTINLAGSSAQTGDTWTCTATVDDGGGTPESGTASFTLEGCDPSSDETPYDGVDSNCDGLESLNDVDGDGQPDDSSIDYNDDGTPDLGVECAGTWSSTVYYLYCDMRQYWDEGSQFCQDVGYDGLASTRSGSETLGLVALIETTDADLNPTLSYDFAASSFLGYTRYPSYQVPNAPVDANGFSWTDASPATYTNWKAGEPNGAATGEDCLEFIYSSTNRGQWNDAFCYDGQHSTWASPRRRVSCSWR